MNKQGLKTQYHPFEIISIRILFAALIFKTFYSFPTFSQQEFPIGIARIIDLTFLANPTVQLILNICFGLALICYVFGKFRILSTGYLLMHSIGLVSLFYSQGSVGHGYNIVSLVILAQFIAYVVHRLGEPISKPGHKLNVDDVAMYFSQQMIAAVYVIAGVTKLIRSGFVYGIIPGWVRDLQYVSVQIVKSHDQSYYAYLDPSILERGNWIAGVLLANEFLTRLCFGVGLCLELFAFLMLINRRWSVLMGGLLIVLHVGIAVIMNLHFRENIYVLIIFTLHIPWLLLNVSNRLYLGKD